MNQELHRTLEQVGWESLYRNHIEGLTPPNGRSECFSRTPFPDTVDNNPSFSVNAVTGLWYCFQTQRGGNYVQFLATLQATEFDEQTGLAIPDYDGTERELTQQLGIVTRIELEWVSERRELLAGALDLHHRIGERKPWDFSVARQLDIGYDDYTNRVVFPVYDSRGRLINARLYMPGGAPKFLWRISGPTVTGNFVWPRAAWDDEWHILVEGEPDALTLRSLGFPAVSGTGGGNTPVPPGSWYRGRREYIWLDDDTVGRTQTPLAAAMIASEAEECYVIIWPEWPDKPDNADVSDYVLYLRDVEGLNVEQTQERINELLASAIRIDPPNAILAAPPVQTTFSGALNAETVGRRLEFTGRVSAASEQRYFIPSSYQITCPAGGHQFCGRCPMRLTYNGLAELDHDPRDPMTLKLFMVNDDQQLAAVRDSLAIPPQCPEPRGRALTFTAIEPVVINASINETEADSHSSEVSAAERQRREGFVILPPGGRVEENQDYRMTGFALQHPRSQQGVFLLDTLTPLSARHEQFGITPELVEELRSLYTPRGDVMTKLLDVADNLGKGVTLIRERPDLHLAYRTVWHSVLKFTMGGLPVDRGWLECMVLGDTRCGKSVAFRKMAEYYQLGLLVDCKLQTPAGILGSVVTSQSTGERYVLAGIYPQQDGRVICFDEFQAPQWGRGGLIDFLSSTRSEGIVRISKAAQAQFHARVRAIWLANPGQGELIEQMSGHGCEMMRHLISQPEDLARFDFAMTVAKGDVNNEVVNAIIPPAPLRYSAESARALLMWTYSRRPEDIEFTTAAIDAVQELSRFMYEKYSATIPLVEPSDQRTRVAKVALSIAAQCFSTDAEGVKLIVGPEHVYAARRLFSLWYDKNVMGYDIYSEKMRHEQSLEDESAVLVIFNEQMGAYGRTLAKQLLNVAEFTERTFGTFVPGQGMLTRSVIQTLHANRAIRLTQRGRKESYECTPAFTAFLKRYLA